MFHSNNPCINISIIVPKNIKLLIYKYSMSKSTDFNSKRVSSFSFLLNLSNICYNEFCHYKQNIPKLIFEVDEILEKEMSIISSRKANYKNRLKKN